MRKFINLEIRANGQQRLSDLLATLKDSDNKVFTYQKKISEQYAENIFMDINNVGCFKTKRKSLFESCVWVLLSDDVLKVVNITSPKERNLGVVNYNIVLNSFYSDFVSNFIVDGYNVNLTGENLSMEGFLNEETYQKLSGWETICNKDNPLSNPQDMKKWIDFVISVFQHEDLLTSSDFQQWLQEDKGWPILANAKIEELGWLLDYSIEILKKNQQYEI